MKNKKIIFSILAIAVVLVSVAVYLFMPFGESQEEKVKVYVQGKSIVYDGPMAEEGVEQVKKLYTKDINRLILNSPGGEINIGMDLGEWVYDNSLDIEIKDNAFSSAANYVFTAGKNKYLHKNSMVGWHGGVTQENNSLFFKLFMKKYIEESKKRETIFFEKIGVDQRSTIYGQRKEFDKYSEKENYVGWTYTLESMEKLGIKNIKLIDGEWVPASEFNGKKIFTVSEIEQK